MSIDLETLEPTDREYNGDRIYRAEESSTRDERDLVERECSYCKNTMYVKLSELKRGKGKYCGRSCAAKSNSQGSDNPAYKDGRSAKKKELYDKKKENAECTDCGESNRVCLSFHHKYPDKKEGSISRMVRNGVSFEAFKQELNKCEVVCANCHLKRHHD